MTNKNERAKEVFAEWLKREFHGRKPPRIARRLADLELLTTDSENGDTGDLAALQAVSQLSNQEFLTCLMAVDHRREQLSDDALRALDWLTRAVKTAHSHLFSNVGLLLESALNQNDEANEQPWDEQMLATANCLANLTNDQFLSMVVILEARLNNDVEPVRQAQPFHFAAEQGHSKRLK